MITNSKRFASFSAEQQDVVKGAVDLHKHYQFLKNGKTEYAEFAQGGTYEEKCKLFSEDLYNEAVKMSGIQMPTGMSKDRAMMTTAVREAMFALIGEALDVIVPTTILEDFYRVAEVRNMGWGDNMVFHVPSPDLFLVSKVANGVRHGEPQRLWSTDVTLTPVSRSIVIQEDFYRVISGKADWGQWVSRVAQSMETAISVDVYQALFNSYATLPTQLKVAAYTQNDFVKLGQRVEALNRGAKCFVMGTRVALSTVVPTNEYFKMALGQEYNQLGYLGNFHGFELLEIPQKIVASSLDLALDDNTLYFISLGVDKPVKIGFEGSTLVETKQSNDTADMTFIYSIQRKWEVKVITSARYGIMKV